MESLYKLLSTLTGLNRTLKKIIILFHDLIILSGSFIFLLFMFIDSKKLNINLISLLILIILSYLIFSNFFGVYDWIIRQINIKFRKSILLSLILTVLSGFFYNQIFFQLKIDYLFFIAFLLISLFIIILSRTIINNFFQNLTTVKKYKKNALIIFDDYSKLSNIDFKSNFFNENILKAFINYNKKEKYKNINGLNIYIFDEENLTKIIHKFNISNVLIFSNNDKVRKIITSKLFKYNLGLHYLNDINFLKFSIDQNQSPVNFSYIIKRDIIINENLISKVIANKNVLVTGGGGSIGSALVMQLLPLNPSSIIIYDISEYNLYEISKKIENITTETKIYYTLGSVLDSALLDNIFLKYQISIVFHVAAYKHVNITQKNILQVFKNNYYGTKIVSDLAEKFSIENFINISTDKAVNSTNYMGYSKRIAEIYLQTKNSKKINKTKFSIIRFGNVVGSSGSAIPLFIKQIQKGEGVTITDKNVSRYFMTINEAVSLVLETLTFKNNNLFYVLNMGEPLNILSMVKKIINISGFQYSEKAKLGMIHFKFTGLQEGEKISEELFYNKNYKNSSNKNIFNIEENFDENKNQNILKEIDDALNRDDEEKIIHLIDKIKI